MKLENMSEKTLFNQLLSSSDGILSSDVTVEPTATSTKMEDPNTSVNISFEYCLRT